MKLKLLTFQSKFLHSNNSFLKLLLNGIESTVKIELKFYINEIAFNVTLIPYD